MKTLRLSMGWCLFLALLILATTSGMALDLRGAARKSIVQGVAVETVQPAGVQLTRGGAAVKAVINGKNLDRADLQAEVLKAGALYRNVQVLLGDPSAKESRQMELKALPAADPGLYGVRLKAGAQNIDLPFRVQVMLPVAGLKQLTTTPRPVAAKPAGMTLEKAGPAVKGQSLTIAGTQARKTTLAAALAKNDAYYQVVPHLTVKVGGGEFESQETAWQMNTPAKLTFWWTQHSPEAKGGQWEVGQGNSIVMRGNAGIAPPPGQTRSFQIDFTKFVNLPAPSQPVKYKVRVRGTKITDFTDAVDEADFVTPPSNIVEISYVVAQPEEETIFTDLPEYTGSPDSDHDGLKDWLENKLAEDYRPYFIFDADENARGPNEPVVVYQVKCQVKNIYEECTQVLIKYYFLFARDGGWVSCSPICGGSHNGDNEPFDLTLNLHEPDQQEMIHYWSSNWGGERYQGTHPVWYMAAGKHHKYYSTSWDHVWNWEWMCCDDVAGNGDRVFPNVKTGNLYHNVGENNYRLIDDLGILGFPGECAWCGKDFKGGLGDDGEETDPLTWY